MTASTMAATGLSVIVVTYNAAADIGICLTLLTESRIGRSCEVIVVDNASSDGTPDLVAARFPEVRLIAEPVNHGFAGANAIGFAVARGAYVLLLNPDAFLTDPEAVAGMAAHLDAHREVGAVGARLIYPDGSHQVGDAGFEPRPLSVLVHALGLSGRWSLRGLYLSGRDARARRPVAVNWLCGACVMMRREAAGAIDGLRSPLFLYGEDIDWGCRLGDAGWGVTYLPDIAVVHLQGGSGGTRSTRWLDGLSAVYAMRNGGRRLSANAFFAGPMLFGFALRALAYTALGRLRARADFTAKARDMWRFAAHLRTRP